MSAPPTFLQTPPYRIYSNTLEKYDDSEELLKTLMKVSGVSVCLFVFLFVLSWGRGTLA